MIEKEKRISASVFVVNDFLRPSKKTVIDAVNVTHFSRNTTFVHNRTPYSGDFISMNNRRKFTYNEKK